MLIAFISVNAWSVYNFRLDVIRSLLADGHQVQVVASRDPFAVKLEAEGCRFIAVDFDNRSRNIVSDIGLYRQFNKIYQKEKPDLIFHYAIKANIYGTMAAARSGIPSIAVVTGLGYPFSRKSGIYYLVKSLYTIACRKAREVWFLNKEDAALFVNEKIAEIKKVAILPGEGINTSHFFPQPKSGAGPFRFIMCSRLLKSKGIAQYAAACSILRKKKLVFEAVVLGFFEKDHPDFIAPSQIQRWEEENLLQFKGYAEDVRPYLNDADAYVFASYYNEGVPRSLMEAASMELPLIAPRLRGCKDLVIDGQTGVLTQPSDPFDLAAAMEKLLLMDERTRQQMGKKARQHMIAEFGVDKVIRQYRTVIESLQQ